MTDTQRIERLERVLGTLIGWLMRELGRENVKKLLELLNTELEP